MQYKSWIKKKVNVLNPTQMTLIYYFTVTFISLCIWKWENTPPLYDYSTDASPYFPYHYIDTHVDINEI